MHNLSDEEMDRLSREAADKYTTPVPPGNWEKLSALLDKEMPVAEPLWKKWVWPLSDLLLLIFAFYAYTGYDPLPAEKPANNIEYTADSQIPNAGSGMASTGKSGSNKPIGQVTETRPSSAEEVQAGRNIQKDNQQRTHLPVISKPENRTGKGRRLSPGRIDSKSVASQTQRSDKPGDVSANTVTTDKNKAVTNAGLDNANDQLKNDMVPRENPVKEKQEIDSPLSIPAENRMTDNDVVPKSQDDQSKPSDSASTKAEGPDSVRNNRSEKAKKLFTGKKGRWEAGVLYSPDFSRVGSAKAVKNGHNFGISLGYHLDDRWSVQTGAIYSRKNYTALETGYQKVPGYSSYDPNIKVKKVQAECFMWEIPLNIRYNFLVRRSQKAFVSAGVSSYFMEKEDLHYWYTYNSNPRYKAWINEQNSSYWLSVAGLSAGFEQYITPSLSIQAEPFFRFTLKEIGYGYINLKTMGIFLGVKYSPPPRSSKK